MIEFKVISDTNERYFEDEVQKALNNDWEIINCNSVVDGESIRYHAFFKKN